MSGQRVFHFTAFELAHYGHAKGDKRRWCGCCQHDFSGGNLGRNSVTGEPRRAFKCFSCAVYQANEVERILIHRELSSGTLEAVATRASRPISITVRKAA